MTTGKLSVAIFTFSNFNTLFYYSKAIGIYDELIKRGDPDQQIFVYKACCLYALSQFKEAKVECEKSVEDSPLKMRLLFQLA